MKLSVDDVLKYIFSVLVEKGDPVLNISGVHCDIDILNKVIKTVEDHQRFEICLLDVTPFTKEQELVVEEEWWLVTTSQRSCFVQNKSRSGAVKDFLTKFPGKDTPDVELARGFEFISHSS